ncbi:sensor histidine kinase [Aurantibacillus circumpalustris]|uniref:sensor histidine kinase n=1 Tax=Aurantibacillus circumpalustris TaxID=3036359 RepID=UPI00295B0535|nr:HAMP domain-containing sensor histidine kinase [Aurantibacillus circumpalustris]
MKTNRTYLFIASSSIALLVVLIIQVNWILETAKIKEELFTEKANIVLSRTAEAVSSDSTMRTNIESGLSKEEVSRIDSLLMFYMRFYNIRIAYYFEVKPGQSSLKKDTAIAHTPYTKFADTYTQCLKENNGSNALELKLVFPDKEEFIIEEMGIPFISSVLLILIVGVMFWRTSVSLLKEKQISEHTTDFLNNMTHEFKTPLTNIALAGKMMIKESNSKQEEKVKHYCGIILEENEKLSRQVEQVLSMTALERGEIPIQKTDLDIHQLINDSIKCIHVQIENANGGLLLNLNAEKFAIKGDKTHLTNALCNLIDNAIKYSEEKPEIKIETTNNTQNLIIQISDSGIGIDSEYHEKVFEKFFRVPTGNVHDVKGFGLGLAYIKKIIELHGGKIELESERGEGTTFIISLPYV